MEDFDLRKFENAETIIEIMNKYTRLHVGTNETPCIFEFQFKEIAYEILNSIK